MGCNNSNHNKWIIYDGQLSPKPLIHQEFSNAIQTNIVYIFLHLNYFWSVYVNFYNINVKVLNSL